MNKFPLNDEKVQVLGYFSFKGQVKKQFYLFKSRPPSDK